MIAIPNMEMPTNCIDCIAHRSYDHDEYFWHGSNYCKALGKYFNKDKLDIDPFKQIHPDCPLIEIVRCGECKYYNGHEEYCEIDHFARECGFCYSGKRKTDE